jgi:hypothetical protein
MDDKEFQRMFFKLMVEFIREIGEPVFNHEEQTYFIEFRESTLMAFEEKLNEVLK